VNEAEISPSHSPTEAALKAVCTDNGASTFQQEDSLIDKTTSKLPTPREIEGVRLDAITILALFEQ
jgi:hypothetical protein